MSEEQNMQRARKSKFLHVLINTLIVYGLAEFISDFWVLLEYIFYGAAQPSIADFIIWIMLTASLYFHIIKGVEDTY